MYAFKAVACVLLVLVISASHLTAMATTTTTTTTTTITRQDLCSPNYFNKVLSPTHEESTNFLSLLNVSDCKIKQLDDLNVTRSVCGVLAAHETAKKAGRSFQEEKVRTYSILIQLILEGPQSNSTESLSYIRNYCLYKFGVTFEALQTFHERVRALRFCASPPS